MNLASQGELNIIPQDQAVLLLPQDMRASVASDLKSKLMKPPVRLDANENRVILFVMPEPPNLPDLKRFKVYEYEYYFTQPASLPEKFNVSGIDFIKLNWGQCSNAEDSAEYLQYEGVKDAVLKEARK